MRPPLANAQDASSAGAATPRHHLAGHACDQDVAFTDDDDGLQQPHADNSPRDERSAVLVVLSVNDVHDMLPGHDGRGGIASLATLLDRERARAPEDATVLVTLNGDFLNGSEMGQKLQGAHSIELLHHVGVDFVVPGNHEFDFGERVLRERVAASAFTWLGANVLDRSTGQLFAGFAETRVVELQDGLRVGLFGVCTPETPNTSSPGDNIEFRDVAAAARRCVHELREKEHADFIVALTHMHLRDDKALARSVPEIDLILGGHDHEPYTMYEGRTLLHKSGQNACWLARLEFELHASGERGASLEVTPQWSMIANQHIRAQPACEQIVVKYLRQLAAMENGDEAGRALATVVTYPLSTETMALRSRASNMGHLVADALRREMKSDYAMINGGFVRGDAVYRVGEHITVGTLDHEMPFPRPAVVVRLAARDFREALEQQLALFPQVSSSHPHVSGLCVTYDRTRKRVVQLEDAVTGQPIDDSATITVATSDFVAHGGDACTAWRRGEIVATGDRVAVVVGRFLEQLQQVAYPPTETRIAFVEGVSSTP